MIENLQLNHINNYQISFKPEILLTVLSNDKINMKTRIILSLTPYTFIGVWYFNGSFQPKTTLQMYGDCNTFSLATHCNTYHYIKWTHRTVLAGLEVVAQEPG